MGKDEWTYWSWYVYIVELRNGNYYTGVTTDVERRVHEHNHVKSRASSICWSFRPVKLRVSLSCGSKSEAFKKEAMIKKMTRTEKERLMGNRTR